MVKIKFCHPYKMEVNCIAVRHLEISVHIVVIAFENTSLIRTANLEIGR
jgi:hypothetical protein